MTPNLDWLKRLSRNNKGIWGIEYPLGTFPQVECITKSLPPSCEIKVLYVSKDDEGINFSASSQGPLKLCFSEIVELVSVEASENRRLSMCIIVENFHNASVIEQCNLIKTARSIQESKTSLSCQFIFLGSWGYYSFRSAYREIYGHTSSPPAESKNILRVPSWSTNDVLELLSKQGLTTTAVPSEIDIVASDFLIEQTGGDEFLIRKAIEHLKEQEGKWPNDIEQVLDELVLAPDVIDQITLRIEALEGRPKSELIKLLHFQRLIREYESIDCEQLWLAGLVQCQKLEGGKQFIQIAGPLINTIVRRVLESEKSISLAPPNYLCFEREAISTAAYRRVAQIENMLRNLIVSRGYIEHAENWSVKLAAIKTPARGREDHEEIIKLVTNLVKSELLSIGIGKKNSETETEPASVTGPAARTRQTNVLESARDWQKRQREHHGVELADDNLMHFLTTESLESVLLNKNNGFFGDGNPFKKEYLVTALEEYRAIRSAIAHNQPIKLITISRLDDLQRRFTDWLTVCADQKDFHK
jgi:hypothetical protein